MAINFRNNATRGRTRAAEQLLSNAESAQRQQAVAAQDAERNRAGAEGWIRAGAGVVGAVGSLGLGPAGLAVAPLVAEAAIQGGRVADPGPAAELSGQSGAARGMATAGALTSATGAVNQYEMSASREDDRMIQDRIEGLALSGRPEGMREAQFLSTPAGRSAFLAGGPGSFGADNEYRRALSIYGGGF